MSNLRCLESFLGNLHTPRYFWNEQFPAYNVNLNGTELLVCYLLVSVFLHCEVIGEEASMSQFPQDPLEQLVHGVFVLVSN